VVRGRAIGHVAEVAVKVAKRRGRPFKEAILGQRAPLGLLVRAEIKQLIDERAKANGRTQSQEAEALIERCLTYDRILDAIDRMGWMP
jgi:hypothetical protein